MTDRISIRGLRVHAYHGVMPEEQREGQVFIIDVDLEVDLRTPARTDRLDHTVDYAAMARRIEKLVVQSRWNLIETVADRVAASALEETSVQSATVTVRKPDAPVGVDVDEVAVTISRRRD